MKSEKCSAVFSYQLATVSSQQPAVSSQQSAVSSQQSICRKQIIGHLVIAVDAHPAGVEDGKDQVGDPAEPGGEPVGQQEVTCKVQ